MMIADRLYLRGKNMKKLLFIFNPHSGTGKIGGKLVEVLDVFTKAGYDTVAYPTQYSRDGLRKIREEGLQYDRIVVSGGDGMLHEAVNGVVNLPEERPLGYIPTGTINDFASSSQIPFKIEDAAKVAVSDHFKKLDVGVFKGEIFSYVAAFGLVTKVSYDTNQTYKNLFGSLAYGFEAMKSLDNKHFEEESKYYTIETDNGELGGIFVFGAVTNSHSVAGMKNFFLSPVVLDDGVLEGIFIRSPKSVAETELLHGGIFENSELSLVERVRSKHFKITCHEETPVYWTLDGENGGPHNEVNISVKKQALTLVAP